MDPKYSSAKVAMSFHSVGIKVARLFVSYLSPSPGRTGTSMAPPPANIGSETVLGSRQSLQTSIGFLECFSVALVLVHIDVRSAG
jgi:hypothetical protein